MSKVRADEYYDRAGTGRPSFPRGLTGVAVTVTNTTASTSTTTGALVVSGGVGIAGSMHVGENVSIGGTLTYEDVTNIDSVGIITARTGVRITAGGLVVTAGVVTFTDSIGGEFKVGSAVTIGSAGLSTFSNGADFNGKLIEETEIVANKASTGFEQINIDKGMIHHFTTLETECFIPDIISTACINTDLNIGDSITVSVACSAVATGWAATVYIDGQNASSGNNQTEWSGGSAPSSGGAGGSYDWYTYNIIKRADAGFIVFANQTNFA